MSRLVEVPVLVFDDDPQVIEDFQIVLDPPQQAGDGLGSLGIAFEAELIGARSARSRFREIELTTHNRSEEAVEAVRRRIEEGGAFRIAFIDAGAPPGNWGLDTAAALRALDPKMHIVLTIAQPGLRPADLSARISPADRLSLLRKPVFKHEIEQLILAAEARHAHERADDLVRCQARDIAAKVLTALPIALVVAEADGRIVVATGAVSDIFPEYRGGLVPGAYLPERLAWIAHSGGTDLLPGDGQSADKVKELKLDDGRCVVVASARSDDRMAISLFLDVSHQRIQEARRSRHARATQLTEMVRALSGDLSTLVRESARVQRHAAPKFRTRVGFHSPLLADQVQELIKRLDSAVAAPGEFEIADDLENRMVDIAAGISAERAECTVEVSADSGLWRARWPAAGFGSVLSHLLRNFSAASKKPSRVLVRASNARPARGVVLKRGLADEEFVCLAFTAIGSGQTAAKENGGNGTAPKPQRGMPEHDGGQLGLCLAQFIAMQVGGFAKTRTDPPGGESVEIYLPRATAGPGGVDPVREPGRLRKPGCTPEYQAGA